MRIKLLLSLTISMLIVLGACTNTSIEEIDAAVTDTTMVDTTGMDTTGCGFDSSTVSYQDNIIPIINRYCSDNINGPGSCHAAGTSRDWTDYTTLNLLATTGTLRARVLDPPGSQEPMPPTYSQGPMTLTDCEREALDLWIAIGAPDN